MKKAEDALEKAQSSSKELEAQQQIKKAVEFALEATDLDPDNPEIWFRQGNIYLKLIDLDVKGAKAKAIESYEKAIELDPGNDIYQKKLEEAKEAKVNP